jgi:hypothetical protein
MEKPLLNDQGEYPDDSVLARHLGRAKGAWDAFVAGVASRFPDASLEWRYYNDGKAWLCKMVRKKKTVCWVSVWDKRFKTTFYFTDKNDKDIAALPIAPDLKASYAAHDRIGKLRPLTVVVAGKKGLEPVFEVAKYKIRL